MAIALRLFLVCGLISIAVATSTSNSNSNNATSIDQLINQVCNKTGKAYANICIRSLSRANTRGVTDVFGLGATAIRVASKRASATSAYASALAKQNRDSKLKQTLSDCVDSLNSLTGNLAQAAGDFSTQHYDMVGDDVSEDIEDVSSCKDSCAGVPKLSLLAKRCESVVSFSNIILDLTLALPAPGDPDLLG